MISSFVYFIGSIFFFILFIFFLKSNGCKKNENVFYFSMAFLVIFLFNFLNSVPILTTGESNISAWANVFANIAVFFIIFLCLRIQYSIQDAFISKNIKKIDLALLILALVSIFFQILYLQKPMVSYESILWNIHPVSRIIIGVTTFCYAMYWSYFFAKIARLLKEIKLKVNMYTLSFNGILQGFAALFLFIEESTQNQFIGLGLLCASAVISMIVFIIPEFSNKKHFSPLNAKAS